MSNWGGLLEVVRKTGTMPSFFPVDLALPAVAPEDLGEAAACTLTAPRIEHGMRHIEGPDRVTPNEVADAFAEALGMPITATPIRREEWPVTFRKYGFSPAAAASYSCMAAAVVDGRTPLPQNPERGSTTLKDFLCGVAAQS